MKKVLVTGGAGFIGSHFIEYMRDAHEDWAFVNLDALTYAGNPDNLKDAEGWGRYDFVKGDIADGTLISSLFKEHRFDIVVNFAAESHVDRSIEAPEAFLKTNVLGAQRLMECARERWQMGRDARGCPVYRPGVRFVQVSTDEVYGERQSAGGFDETAPLRPGSPYAASKAAADLMALAYGRTYRFPCVITRCSNNYGPRQFPEKLIPLMICRALEDKPLPVYGDGLHVRDWLHVRDHCRAIDAVLCRGRDGEAYNIGGGSEKTNLEVVRMILKELGRDDGLIRHVADRPGHDRRYALSRDKIASELGWSPRVPFEKGLKDTVAWYRENMEWVRRAKERAR